MYINLIGQQFAAGHQISALLEPECEVALLREPSNQYDPNAIQVWVDRKYLPDELPKEIPESCKKENEHECFIRLGYIRREQAAEVSPEMDRRDRAILSAKHIYEGMFELVFPEWKVEHRNKDDNTLVTTKHFETKTEAMKYIDKEVPLEYSDCIHVLVE